MSYSFQVSAPTKADAKAQIVEKFAEVLVAQPSHKVDVEAATACAHAMVDVLHDDDSEGVRVACNGSLSGTWANGSDLSRITSASCTVTAYRVKPA